MWSMNCDKNEMKYEMKRKYESMNLEVEVNQQISKQMIIINDNDYSNTYDESDDNKTTIKE